MARLIAALALLFAAAHVHASDGKALALEGFIDAEGAVTVLRHGDTVDPYFAMQALLLARDSGLEVRALAERWVRWLLPWQKPDATFDRFCRRGPVWAPCKTADADDALHAAWIRMTSLVKPTRELAASRAASERSLARLLDPARGVYLVSPVFQHALLMDNVEVWAHHGRDARLAQAIDAVFWDASAGRYRVSTQQRARDGAFYPEAAAQLWPLLAGLAMPVDARAFYRDWMRENRARWLRQSEVDFAWGVIAVVAWRHGDRGSAACWLRESRARRDGPHWMVTDEAAYEILSNAGVGMAPATARCD